MSVACEAARRRAPGYLDPAHAATRRRARQLPARVSFFFNDTATTEIYTLSLHDAPSDLAELWGHRPCSLAIAVLARVSRATPSTSDRKSTRLNSSHLGISYAVFCLKK